jgi:hypothetical protein
LVSIKAQPFKSLLKFLEKDLTPAQREAAIASLPEEYRTYTRKIVLASDRLPLELVNSLTEAAAAARGEPLEDFARRAGRFAADEAVHSIYRWLAFLTTPDYILGKVSRTWLTFYDQGKMSVERLDEHHARVTLSDFPAFPAVCARVTGWMQELGEMTKRPNLEVVHDRCRARGAPAC